MVVRGVARDIAVAHHREGAPKNVAAARVGRRCTTMTVLNDRSIAEAIERGAPPLATQIDPSDIGRKDSRIQPASLDLSIGEIRLPGSELDRSGSHAHPLHRHALKEGETAVVTTLEELEIPSDMSAIGIPPSSISLAGLLMTNRVTSIQAIKVVCILQ